eukprot:CAMPEP_0176404064 /NCGR_PEP_ID=MMETSP0126-20121128/50576_1 /TAXON_ID=141414 ORGANISM="Strombidinopsis acuminatum, Strain SPMC142" /NCGR_SAMPLE_ID=MMETSP0126 /ASSEMBLY_ACC=CAM_ASM_000229 /LENGTH=53 /DNA_ID=CAMNT_0017782651 /DNA_START=1626 /DNA_END=1787 /DNA_ORIENTATION=+
MKSRKDDIVPENIDEDSDEDNSMYVENSEHSDNDSAEEDVDLSSGGEGSENEE